MELAAVNVDAEGGYIGRVESFFDYVRDVVDYTDGYVEGLTAEDRITLYTDIITELHNVLGNHTLEEIGASLTSVSDAMEILIKLRSCVRAQDDLVDGVEEAILFIEDALSLPSVGSKPCDGAKQPFPESPKLLDCTADEDRALDIESGSPPSLNDLESAPQELEKSSHHKYCWICTGSSENDVGSDGDLSTDSELVPLLTGARSDSASRCFIAPCLCKGDMKHVHHGCLLRWIETKRDDDPAIAPRCPACLYEYHIDYRVRSSLPRGELSLRLASLLIATAALACWVWAVICLTSYPNSEYILHYIAILALVGWWLLSTAFAALHKLISSLRASTFMEPTRIHSREVAASGIFSHGEGVCPRRGGQAMESTGDGVANASRV
eukprot:Rmarinus@m.12789